MAFSANFLTFISDPDRVEKWLFEVGYYDPGTQAEGTLYFSSHAYANGSQGYLARLLEGINFETSALGAASLIGAPGLADVPKAGVVKVGQINGDLDYLWGKGYVFSGRTATIKLGGYSRRLGGELAYADYGVIRVADVGNVIPGDTEVSFELRDKGEILRKPLQNRRFSGSDWSIRCTSAATSYITLGTPSALDITGDLTVAARLRAKSHGANVGAILSWRKSGTTTFPFAFGYNATGSLYFAATGVTTVTTTAALATETEYLVAVAVQGSSCVFYIFDLFAGTTTVESFTLSASTRSAHVGGELRISHHNGTNLTDCVFDWVAAWNSTKTQDFLAELRDRQLSAVEAAASDCVLLCRMEEGSGTTTADASATAATGTFSGTPTWALSLGGGSQLEGQVKPDCWGAYNRMTPALVWPLKRIYCVSGAKTNSVLELHEGGLTMTVGTAYTDQETFLAASTTAARYDTLIWAGGTFVRLGSTPNKPITVSGLGNLNPAGSYVNTADGIAKAIAEARAGVTSSLAGIATGSTAVLQYVATAETSCEEALSALFSSVGAIGYWGRQDGLLMAKVLAEDPTVAVAAALDARSIESAEPVSLDQPVSLVKVRYGRNYTPLSVDQQSASVTGTATQLLVEYEWQTVPFTVSSQGNRPRTVERDTCLTVRADAQAAAKREGMLFGRRPRAFEVTADLRGAVVDFGDRVNVRLTDPGINGVPVVRMDLGHGGAEKSGFCLSLNGTSDTVSLGSSSSYAISTYTVEGWFCATVGGTGFRVLCERQTSSSNRTWWLALWNGSAGVPLGSIAFRWSVGTTTGYNLRTPTDYNYADGQWHHVAATINGTTACLYVDGVLVATRSSGGTVDTPASRTVYLGSEEGSSRWFGGYLREWRIWSVVRTASQVYAYRKVPEANPSGLAVRLKLDDMRGALAKDAAGGDPVAITGGTWAESYGYTPCIVLAAAEVSGGERAFGRTKLTLWRST